MCYTYLIKCTLNNMYYYGVRWANKTAPDQDLWIKYFTSSKVIKRLITQHGKDIFKVQIRRTFRNKFEAIKWEETVLSRMKILNKPDKWLNKCISKAIRYVIHPRLGIPVSAETILKISKSLTGRKASLETRLKQSLAKKGKPLLKAQGSIRPYVTIRNKNRSKQQKILFQEACVKAHSKTYKLLSPEKEKIIITNLAKFARENSFDNSALLKHNKAKGWVLLERL